MGIEECASELLAAQCQCVDRLCGHRIEVSGVVDQSFARHEICGTVREARIDLAQIWHDETTDLPTRRKPVKQIV